MEYDIRRNKEIIMQIENIIINEYLENNSFITTKQAESMGISRHILSLMAKEEKIKRVKQGIYTKNDKGLDIYYLLSLNTNKIIFSYETALFLNNYISKEPKNIHITVPQGYNVNRIKKKADNITFHYVNINNFEDSKINIITKQNNEIKVYSVERTCLEIYNRDKNTKIIKKIFMTLNEEKKKNLKEFLLKNKINLNN